MFVCLRCCQRGESISECDFLMRDLFKIPWQWYRTSHFLNLRSRKSQVHKITTMLVRMLQSKSRKFNFNSSRVVAGRTVKFETTENDHSYLSTQSWFTLFFLHSLSLSSAHENPRWANNRTHKKKQRQRRRLRRYPKTLYLLAVGGRESARAHTTT